MKINSNSSDGFLNIELDGRLDTTTAPELERFIGENYSGTGSIVINCERLEYISSAGLRVLLSTQKKTKGNMRLKNVCELVMEVFELTGFADILVIE